MNRFPKLLASSFLFFLIASVLTSSACRFGPPKFNEITEDFVFSTLSFSPVTATSVGYHLHAGVPLDELMDDMSQAALNRQRAFYHAFSKTLDKTKVEKLTPEDRADYMLIRNRIKLALLDLETIQRYKHDPMVYTDLIGQALFTSYTLDYAPKDLRFFHIVRRMESFPALLNHARLQLTDSPEIMLRLAREAVEANIAMIDKTLRPEVPENLKSKYSEAATNAIAALKDFDQYLANDLSKKPSDWRLGPEKYNEKFKYSLDTDRTPEKVLADAESTLAEIQEQMSKLTKGKIKAALDKLAAQHATPENYFAEARADLEESRTFVKTKVLLPLPENDNLKVIETPVFLRGSYPVGGFNPAPALEPNLQAQYWLTPIPKDWPKERVESKLREYNTYGLKLLTIHEAIPGHYTQFEYANAVQPRGRRLLRSIYGSGSYIEGWAVYATQMMIEEGYLSNNEGLRLTFLKQLLRAISNTILDIRLHTMNMTDEEAIKLMIDGTFQEREEAEAKLQRAKITSGQLPTYFIGWLDWLRLRERDRGFRGKAFSLPAFHERALKTGALPVPLLSILLTGQPLPERPTGPLIAAPVTPED